MLKYEEVLYIKNKNVKILIDLELTQGFIV
jgi:hypothetical protein